LLIYLNLDKEQEKNFTIEHIMPQTLPADNKTYINKNKKCINKIGNLTLLEEKINTKLGNKNFNEKMKEYKKSVIIKNRKLNKFLVKNSWTDESIKKREEEIINYIWNFLLNLSK